MLGSMTKESSWKLLDAYYEAGGNFIDTAVGIGIAGSSFTPDSSPYRTTTKMNSQRSGLENG
jgi:hypothetical protein